MRVSPPFFLPAEFQSLQAPLQGIPEPATWGLMILALWQGRCEPSRFAATPRDCNRSPTRLSRASGGSSFAARRGLWLGLVR